MYDFESRRVIEALRSGVPSRFAGRYFSEARPELMNRITDSIGSVRGGAGAGGMVLTGRYGEGKTHLLNTVFNIAHEKNMAVSMISLSKETPLDKLQTIYQKIVANTYLPGREQPGFGSCFETMSLTGPRIQSLLRYASTELETNKLYYVLSTLLKAEDAEIRFKMQADLEGDVQSNADIKRAYKALFHETAAYNVNFSKTKHFMDYFRFFSKLMEVLGCDGWVILFDEAELTGRLGKKARMKSYKNMSRFLFPAGVFSNVFSVFAFSSSYAEDVIDGKHEYENLEELTPEDKKTCKKVLDSISRATELKPLTQSEIESVIARILSFHSAAYSWSPLVPVDAIVKKAQASGFLLRTKLRTAIEILDQLYQYGKIGNISVGSVADESYEEIPSLDILPDSVST